MVVVDIGGLDAAALADVVMANVVDAEVVEVVVDVEAEVEVEVVVMVVVIAGCGRRCRRSINGLRAGWCAAVMRARVLWPGPPAVGLSARLAAG